MDKAHRALRDGLEGDETDVLWTGAEVINGTYKIVGRPKRVDGPPEWLVEDDAALSPTDSTQKGHTDGDN